MRQDEIDQVRMRVMSNMLVHGAIKQHTESFERIWHLWFPRDSCDAYELRTGNPPADVDRPPHLKGKHLVVDMTDVPAEVWDEIKARVSEHERSKYRLVKIAEHAVLERGSLIKAAQLPKG